MQTIIAIDFALCFGLETASAQQVHSLKVSIHKDVPPLTKDQVDEALVSASKG